MQQDDVQSEGDFREHDAVFIMLPPQYSQVERSVVVQILHDTPVIPHRQGSVVVKYFLDGMKAAPHDPERESSQHSSRRVNRAKLSNLSIEGVSAVAGWNHDKAGFHEGATKRKLGVYQRNYLGGVSSSLPSTCLLVLRKNNEKSTGHRFMWSDRL